MSEQIEVYGSENNTFEKDGGKMLTFLIENQKYGIEISRVSDIIEVSPITIIPKVPKYIKGVINLRGKVTPVMSLRQRFNKEQIPYDSRTCIVVVHYDDIFVGIIVDRVSEVVDVLASSITAPPTNKSVNINNFISHIVNNDEGVTLVLDCKKLIFE